MADTTAQGFDRVYQKFLDRQQQDALDLSRDSDLVGIEPLGDTGRFIARFTCKGLVRASERVVVEHDLFGVGIWFPQDYLRIADPFRTLTWLGPAEVFHPNISDAAICIGTLAPGTGIIDLVYRCFDLITYRKVTMREDDALNREACAWARENQGRFPLDTRQLKRRPAELAVERCE